MLLRLFYALALTGMVAVALPTMDIMEPTPEATPIVQHRRLTRDMFIDETREEERTWWSSWLWY